MYNSFTNTYLILGAFGFILAAIILVAAYLDWGVLRSIRNTAQTRRAMSKGESSRETEAKAG
jgi:hypothetical protein